MSRIKRSIAFLTAALLLLFCLPMFAVAEEETTVPGPAGDAGVVEDYEPNTDADTGDDTQTDGDETTTAAPAKDEPINQPTTDTSAYLIKDEKHTVYKVPDQTFTGSAIKPDLIIEYHFGRTTEIDLEVQTDYMVEYSDNEEVGIASAHIVYLKDFAELGEETVNFKIVPRDASSSASIAPVDTQYYTGSEIEPGLDISVGNNELLEGIDYIVEYINNVEPGTATAKVTYIGNYKGNAKAEFIIRKNASRMAVVKAIPDQTYTGDPITPDIDITAEGKNLIEGDDFEVSFSKNTNVGTAIAKITYIGNYSGTKTVTFKILPKDGSSLPKQGIKDVDYSGDNVYLDIKITDGTKELTSADYTVNYLKDYTDKESEETNTGVGKATVNIIFQGNYTGVYTTQFNIKPLVVTGAKIAAIAEQPYAFGRPVTPDALVSATIEGKNINFEEGVDYVFEYTNNRKVGDAGIKAVFIGNYSGSVSSTFKIGAADVSDAFIAPIPDQKYTGNAINPKLKVYVGKNKLKKDRDYTVAYSNNTAIGQATATVTFKGNYKGTATATFNISETGASSIAQTGEIGAAVIGGIAVVAGVTFFIVRKKKNDTDED